MSSTMDANTYNLVLNDLKYALEFKANSVLFTSGNGVIGLGEMGSYFRVEGNIMPSTYLKNYIIESKSIRDLLKLDAETFMQQDFHTYNPLVIIGVSPVWIERKVMETIWRCSEDRMVFNGDITASDSVVRLKRLKAEEGMFFDVVETRSGQVLAPMNKKFIPVVATDKVILRVFDLDDVFYLCYEVVTRKHYVFSTYIKTVRV